MFSKYSKYSIYVVWLLMGLPAMHGVAQSAKADKKIKITNDIVYKKLVRYPKDTSTLRLDLYSDFHAPDAKQPAIIFVHGGGFWSGDKRSGIYVKMAMAFATRNYTVISVNYTLKGKDEVFSQRILDTCVEEVMEAVNWMKANADRLGVDTSRIIICGDSAGGGIVINASYSPQYRQHFIGCIDLWGGLPGKDGWEAPIYTGDLTYHIPATCIIHGTADRIVPYETSSRLSTELTAANVSHTLHPLKGADHYPVQLADQFIPVMVDFANEITQQKNR